MDAKAKQSKASIAPLTNNPNDDYNVNRNSHTSRSSIIENQKTRMAITRKFLDYVDEIFPAVYSSKNNSLAERMLLEAQEEHVLLRMFCEKDFYQRVYTDLEIVTLISLTLLVAAFICSLEFDQDDGTCGEFKTRSECVHDISLFDTSRARC